MAYEDEIEEIEKDMDESEKSFSLLAVSLGSAASRLDCLSESASAHIERITEIRNERKSAQAELQLMKETVISFEERKARVSSLEQQVKEDSDKAEKLLLRLGAVIYEKCSFALLDKSIFSSVYEDVEEDRKLQEASSPFHRILNHGRNAIRRLGRDSRYISYAETALSADVQLDGNASSIISDLLELRKGIETMIAEKKAIETSIESDSESYRDLVRKKISETEDSIRNLDDAEKAGEEELGRLLFSTGGDWIGEDTPHDILDIVEQMLGIMQHLDELRYKHGCLERNAKRDEYLAMIESEAGKIKVLEDDKARIEREIEDIRLEIARLQREADKLAGDEYV